MADTRPRTSKADRNRRRRQAQLRDGAGEPPPPQPLPLFPEACKLMLENIPYSVDDAKLRSWLASYGTVAGVQYPKQETGIGGGYAFVEFATAEQATAALDTLNGASLMGRQLRSKPYQTKGQLPKRGSGRPDVSAPPGVEVCPHGHKCDGRKNCRDRRWHPPLPGQDSRSKGRQRVLPWGSPRGRHDEQAVGRSPGVNQLKGSGSAEALAQLHIGDTNTGDMSSDDSASRTAELARAYSERTGIALPDTGPIERRRSEAVLERSRSETGTGIDLSNVIRDDSRELQAAEWRNRTWMAHTAHVYTPAEDDFPTLGAPKSVVEEGRRNKAGNPRPVDSPAPAPTLSNAPPNILEWEVWTVEDVCSWVQSLPKLRAEGKAVITAAFAENGIDGSNLIDITKQMLKDDLGVDKLGDQLALVSALKELKQQLSPQPAAGLRHSASWSPTTAIQDEQEKRQSGDVFFRSMSSVSDGASSPRDRSDSNVSNGAGGSHGTDRLLGETGGGSARALHLLAGEQPEARRAWVQIVIDAASSDPLIVYTEKRLGSGATGMVYEGWYDVAVLGQYSGYSCSLNRTIHKLTCHC